MAGGVWPPWWVPQPSLGAALLPHAGWPSGEWRSRSRLQGRARRAQPRVENPSGQRDPGWGGRAWRWGDAPGPGLAPCVPGVAPNPRLSQLGPTQSAGGLAFLRLRPVPRVKPPPEPHPDLPSPPGSDLSLCSAFVVWPQGRRGARPGPGVLLGRRGAAFPSPGALSPGLGLRRLFGHSHMLLQWRRWPFPVDTAAQP